MTRHLAQWMKKMCFRQVARLADRIADDFADSAISCYEKCDFENSAEYKRRYGLYVQVGNDAKAQIAAFERGRK